MSALPTGSTLVERQATNHPKTRGFLHIVRHGSGLNAFYILTYHRLDRSGTRPKAMLAEGAQSLIDLLEKVGVDFRVREVRGALEDILRLGSANIPDLWLSDEEILERGMIEAVGKEPDECGGKRQQCSDGQRTCGHPYEQADPECEERFRQQKPRVPRPFI